MTLLQQWFCLSFSVQSYTLKPKIDQVHKDPDVQDPHAQILFIFTVSTEIATHSKSAWSRNSDSSVSRDTNSDWDFGFIWIRTKWFEFLDLVDFGGVAFSVESVISRHSRHALAQEEDADDLHVLFTCTQIIFICCVQVLFVCCLCVMSPVKLQLFCKRSRWSSCVVHVYTDDLHVLCASAAGCRVFVC